MTPLVLTVITLIAVFAVSTIAVVVLIKRAPLVEDELDCVSSEQIAGRPGAVSLQSKSGPRSRTRRALGPVYYVPHAGKRGGSSQARIPR
jgi:hypothetical protein